MTPSVDSPQVVILAAGQGERLRPLTEDRPKCLIEVAGAPLLERQLSVLRGGDVGEIVVVGGYLGSMLDRPGITLRHNDAYASTNMVHSLFCVDDALRPPIVVAYGDILYSAQVLDALLASTADIGVVVDLDWRPYWEGRSDDPLTDAESLRLRADGTIQELGQRPRSMDDIDGQYIGLMRFSDRGLEQLRQTHRDALRDGILGGRPVAKAYMTDLIQAAIDGGYRVDAVTVHGGWIEIDTLEDLDASVTFDRLRDIALRTTS